LNVAPVFKWFSIAVNILPLNRLVGVIGDEARRAEVIPELRAADDYTLITTVWRSAVYSDDLSAVGRYAALLIEPQRPPRCGHSATLCGPPRTRRRPVAGATAGKSAVERVRGARGANG
jgi:hypothetical protein